MRQVDYAAEDVKTHRVSEQATCNSAFVSEELCRGRAVTDLSWSPHHPELLLASYDKGVARARTQVAQTDGLALVWSTSRLAVRLPHVSRVGCRHFRYGLTLGLCVCVCVSLCVRAFVPWLLQAPEYTFTCQTAVLTSTFHTFSPHIVLGGCYSGQVRLDARTHEHHTHPHVCGLCSLVAWRSFCCLPSQCMWCHAAPVLSLCIHRWCFGISVPRATRCNRRPFRHKAIPTRCTGACVKVACARVMCLRAVRALCLSLSSAAIVGASNAHSLLTISVDGKMCMWNTTKLVEPVVCARGVVAAVASVSVSVCVAVCCCVRVSNHTFLAAVVHHADSGGAIHLIPLRGARHVCVCGLWRPRSVCGWL